MSSTLRPAKEPEERAGELLSEAQTSEFSVFFDLATVKALGLHLPSKVTGKWVGGWGIRVIFLDPPGFYRLKGRRVGATPHQAHSPPKDPPCQWPPIATTSARTVC